MTAYISPISEVGTKKEFGAQYIRTPVPLAEDAELLRRGRECAVSLTGDPDDVAEINSPEKAWQAIDEALAMGKQRCGSHCAISRDSFRRSRILRGVYSLGRTEGK